MSAVTLNSLQCGSSCVFSDFLPGWSFFRTDCSSMVFRPCGPACVFSGPPPDWSSSHIACSSTAFLPCDNAGGFLSSQSCWRFSRTPRTSGSRCFWGAPSGFASCQSQPHWVWCNPASRLQRDLNQQTHNCRFLHFPVTLKPQHWWDERSCSSNPHIHCIAE